MGDDRPHRRVSFLGGWLTLAIGVAFGGLGDAPEDTRQAAEAIAPETLRGDRSDTAWDMFDRDAGHVEFIERIGSNAPTASVADALFSLAVRRAACISVREGLKWGPMSKCELSQIPPRLSKRSLCTSG